MRTRFRADIEGLRAVAVALPVLTHAFGILPGGVLGVDVFFVLSGFLITGLLLRDVERDGKVRLGAFAVRRIRRLAPLAVTVVVVTVTVLAPLLLAPARASVFQNALASLTGVENWHLMRSLTNYQAASSGASPLQNYWSLAVEEQFYIALPTVVAVCALIMRLLRRPELYRTLVTATLTLAVLGSMTYCVLRAATNPGALYLDTIGRVWELGLGGLTAIIAPRFREVPRAVGSTGILVGLTAIVVSAVILQDENLVPWPGALPAVLGTTLIALVGHRAGAAVPVVLTNPVSRYLGRISYALYLWHFPAVATFGLFWGFGMLQGILAITVSVALAAASHHWIEVPARNSSWLGSLEHPATRPRVALSALVAPVLAITVITSVGLQFYAPIVRDQAVLAGILTSAESPQGPQRPFNTASLEHALRTATDGHLDPAAVERVGVQHASSKLRSCLTNTDQGADPKVCTDTVPGATKHAWLIGDSTAAAWADAVRAALPRDQWALSIASNAGCTVVDVDTESWNASTAFPDQCRTRRAATLHAVTQADPDLVVISTTDATFGRLSSGATGAAATREWQAGTERLIERLAGHVDRLVFLTPPPNAANITMCATKPTGLTNCTEPLNNRARPRLQAENAATAAERDRVNAVVVNNLDWFCTSAGSCPAVVDGTAIRADGEHIADDMALRLVNLITPILNPAPHRTANVPAPLPDKPTAVRPHSVSTH